MAKPRTYPIEPLTRQEVDAMLRACGRGPAGVRNRALIAVLWRAGLRLGEAIALRPKDVEMHEGRIHVLRGKGAKRRVAGIDSAGGALVAAWIEERTRLGVSPRKPLFCSISRGAALERGAALWPSYVRTMLSRVAARAGVEKRVHPHGLRHTHTRELDEEGLPLAAIRDQLGHASASTTNGYLVSYGAGERVERLRARPGWSEERR